MANVKISELPVATTATGTEELVVVQGATTKRITATALWNSMGFYSGTGAPTISPPDGSIYRRTDGAAATTLYIRAGGFWTPQVSQEVVAFPGAVGFGRLATGGRGGVIRHVTNLNDSGAGSFRTAVGAAGPATVVFDVGGYIALNGIFNIASNITIAGETAPAPGIVFRNYGLMIFSTNVIMRHVTVKHGQDNPGGDETDGIGLRAYSPGTVPSNIIVDHCTFQWAFDENLDMTRSTAALGPHDVTFMNCIFAEGLNDTQAPGGTGGFGPAFGLGALCGAGERITFYRNLFAFNVDRNPALSFTANGQSASYEVVNNLNFGNYYNCNIGNAAYSTALQMDVSSINNYSPETSATDPQPYIIVEPGGWAAAAQARIYASGNVVGSGRSAFSNQNAYNPVVAMPPISSDIPAADIIPADAALRTVIVNNVGARPNNRDAQVTAMIARIAADNVTRQTTAAAYGDYPTIGTGSSGFTDPANPTLDDDGDGWTNLEEALHIQAVARLNP